MKIWRLDSNLVWKYLEIIVTLDKKNEKNKWMEEITKEKDQLFDYETFEVLEKGEKAPKDYTRISGFYVFDVKHDLRRKARFVTWV